jgi:4-amino-4-deoxy-L-arabinose transferase-like glycosyltransferase
VDRPYGLTPKAGLAVVLALGAALRFWNIDAGLPYRISVDEPVIAERAIQMMRTGSFHPGFWDYPGLYIYLQLIVGCVKFVSGAMSGLWRSVNDFHPEHLFLTMRMLNAALGTVTIALVYRAGTRWGPWVALTAAAIFAVWPNHVRESHFALTDVPVTFLTVTTLLLSLRAHETGRLKWFLAAGAGAGLAAATKYTGAYALLLPLTAAAVANTPPMGRIGAAVAAIAAAALAFLIGSPYTLLDLPGFLNGFGALSAYYRPRPFSEGAGFYVGHLRAAVGWSGLIVIVAGLLWGTLRALRDHELRRWTIVLVFPLVFFYSVSTKYLIFGRYLLPMLPALCLIMAFVIVDAATWVWRLNRPLGVRVAILGLALPLLLFHVVRAGVQWPADYGRPTTQDVAYQRIRESIPKGAGVVVERSVLRLPDTLYRKTDVHRFTVRTPNDYISKGTTFVIATSDSFGPILEHPSQFAAEYEAYQRVFNQRGHCLPTIQPTINLTGPQIIICRLDAPISGSSDEPR